MAAYDDENSQPADNLKDRKLIKIWTGANYQAIFGMDASPQLKTFHHTFSWNYISFSVEINAIWISIFHANHHIYWNDPFKMLSLLSEWQDYTALCAFQHRLSPVPLSTAKKKKFLLRFLKLKPKPLYHSSINTTCHNSFVCLKSISFCCVCLFVEYGFQCVHAVFLVFDFAMALFSLQIIPVCVIIIAIDLRAPALHSTHKICPEPFTLYIYPNWNDMKFGKKNIVVLPVILN